MTPTASAPSTPSSRLDSIYLRFFVPMPSPSDALVERTTVVDYQDHVVLVMAVHDKPIGYARLDRLDSESAEVAFNVADAHHGKGIGSILLEHLAAIGLELGVARFVADVLPENRKMLGVFQTAGYAVHSGHEHGYISVSFDITPTAHVARGAAGPRAPGRVAERPTHPDTALCRGGRSQPRPSLGRPQLLAQPAGRGLPRTRVCREPGGDRGVGSAVLSRAFQTPRAGRHGSRRGAGPTGARGSRPVRRQGGGRPGGRVWALR